MKLTCQIIVAAFLAFSFLCVLYQDINGRKERKPRGFEGVIATLIATALSFLLLWKAGTFSLLLP